MGAYKDLSGQRFKQIFVHSHAGFLDNRHRWICRCDCGKWFILTTDRIKERANCGCLWRKNLGTYAVQHGHAKNGNQSSEYSCYYNMLARCHNSRTKQYNDYGGRGITVCTRWRFGDLNNTGFECFVKDVGARPSKEYSIERQDFNGNYEPGNVIWALKSEQNFNTRRSLFVIINGEKMHAQKALREIGISSTKLYYWRNKGLSAQEIFDRFKDAHSARPNMALTANGETLSLHGWARKTGLSRSAIKRRLEKGWSVERAVTTPADERKRTLQTKSS